MRKSASRGSRLFVPSSRPCLQHCDVGAQVLRGGG